MSKYPCNIDGVIIRELKRFTDERGWLSEVFRKDELPPEVFPAMGYVSSTKPGFARGPHEHRAQTDYFCFLKGCPFEVFLWDNRENSPTFRERCKIPLDGLENVLVIIPPGVVHAYKNVGAVDGIILNAPNRLYRGEGKNSPVDEIRYEDDPNNPFKISQK